MTDARADFQAATREHYRRDAVRYVGVGGSLGNVIAVYPRMDARGVMTSAAQDTLRVCDGMGVMDGADA